ncbi:MAG: VCBS repeat-containing protein, partial [Cyclobacteriaceae bacterium]
MPLTKSPFGLFVSNTIQSLFHFFLIKHQRNVVDNTQRHGLKSTSILSCIFFLMLGVGLNAQTPGVIFEPASTSILDPNGDGYVSSAATGFTNLTDDTGEFEISMTALPTFGTGEALADIRSGPSYGFTDFSFDPNGAAAYVANDGTNFIFRFRLSDYRPNAKGYTVLIDSDGQFGSLDPNAQALNPGFEIAVVLYSKNDADAVSVYNIDNQNSCTSPVATYARTTNHQKAIAGISSGGNVDVFYDFFVPISAITSNFTTQGPGNSAVTTSTRLRFGAATNSSNSCAIDASLSDIAGLDNSDYEGCNWCAFEELIECQVPASLNDLSSSTCNGVETDCPVLNTILENGTTDLDGTAEASADIFITVSSGGSTTGYVTSADGLGDWSQTITALADGDVVTIRALASGEKFSNSSCNVTVVNAPCDNAPNYTIINSPNGGNNKLDGNIESGVYAIEMEAYQFDTDFTTTLAGGTITNGSKSSRVGDANYVSGIFTANASAWDFQGGLSSSDATFSNGVIYAIRMRVDLNDGNGFGCWTDFQLFCGKCTNPCSTPKDPSIATTLSAGTTVITGANTGTGDSYTTGDKVYLYMNETGLTGEGSTLLGTGTVTDGITGAWSVTLADELGNFGCGTVIAKVVGIGSTCVSDASTTTATPSSTQSATPAITDSYCGDVTVISGTSIEPEGSLVNLYNSGGASSLVSATVSSQGTWTIPYNTLLSGSTYDVKVTNTSSCISESAAASVTIGTRSAPTGTIDLPADLTESDLSGLINFSGTLSASPSDFKLYVDGVELSLTNKVTGTAWSANVDANDLYVGGYVTLRASVGSNCESLDLATEFIDCTLPDQSLAVGDDEVCADTDQANLTVSNSVVGVLYTPYLDDSPDVLHGYTHGGTTSDITLTTYTYPENPSDATQVYVPNVVIKASRFLGGASTCESDLTDLSDVTVNPLPAPSLSVNVTTNNTCNGGYVTLTLLSSETDVSYQVQSEGVDIPGASETGNGSDIDFILGPFNANVTLSVIATNNITSCGNYLSSTQTITVNGAQNPTTSETFPVVASSSSITSGTSTNILIGDGGNPTNSSFTYYLYNASTDVLVNSATGNSGQLSISTGNLTENSTFYVIVEELAASGCDVQLSTQPVVSVIVPVELNLSATPSVVSESGIQNITYTFTRSGTNSGILSANFNVGGTATFTSDYTQSGAVTFNGSSGTVNIADGSFTSDIVLAPVDDSDIEGDESIQLTITTGSGYTIGTNFDITTTVNDNDGAIAPNLDLDGSSVGSDYTTTFLKGGNSVAISDVTITITDADDTNMESATVSLDTRYNGSNETLSITGSLPSGIIVSNAYDNTDGVLELSGVASIADYQTAIHQIVYNNVSVNPNNEDRIITVVVNDGAQNSNTGNTTMSIKFPPVLTSIGPVETTLEETEVEIDFLEIKDNADESDADGEVVAFVVKAISQGTLRIGTDPISATAFSPGTNDIIQLGSKAFWTPPANQSGTLSAFEIVAKDDEGFESVGNVIVPVIVEEVNDLPVATADTGATNQDTEVVLSKITNNDTDADGTIAVSTVILIDPSNSLNKGIVNDPLIIASLGSFSIDDEANLTFIPVSGFTGSAIVYYTVEDNVGGKSNQGTITITVSGNTAPNVDLDNNDDSGTTGNDLTQSVLDASAGTIIVDNDVNITDATDTQMESLTITLTNRLDGINESLYVDGTLPPGVTITNPYSNADGILELTGTADIDDYENVLRIIKYKNIAVDPDVTDRVITIFVNDGSLNSTVAISTVKIGCGNFTLLDFQAPTLETNVAGTIGDIYRFSDVATGLDALVEITGLVNATLTDIDDDSGNIETLRPFLTATDATVDMYIDLEIVVVAADTSTPTPLGDVSIVGGDVDGINGTRDFMGVKDSPGITIENINNLTRDFEDNFTTFTSSNNNDVNPGSIDEPLHTVYAVFKNASTFQVRGGSKQFTGGGGNDGTRVVEFNLANACYFESYTDPQTTPSSAGKTIVLNEDESFDFNDVDFSFEDADGDAFEAVIIRLLPTNGTLLYNGGAAAIDTEYTDKTLFSFAPDLNENGNPYAEFVFQVKDNSGHAETEFSAQRDTIVFKVLSINDQPIATDDTYILSEGGTLTANDATGTTTGGNPADDGVVVNDTDADNDPLTVQLVTGPSYNGTTFILNPDGTFIYTHDGSENFTDSFTYRITDPDGESSTATVTINITPVNDPPTIDLDGNNSSGATAFDYYTSFQEGGSPIAIADTDVTIVDGDLSDNIESVTIILTNRPDGASETLTVTGPLPGILVISDPYDNADGQLVISGTGTVAEYQQAIQLIVYENTGVGPDVADRNVTLVLTDGDDNSNTATTNIVVSPGDDFDNDGIKDINDLDDDNDGIPDSKEFCLNGGFACLPGGVDPSGDEDGDGISNYEDFDDPAVGSGCVDANLDGKCDVLNVLYDPDGDNIPNHKDYNSDGDNCSDAHESGHGQVVLTGGVITGPFGANGLANRIETFTESGNIKYTLSEKVAGTFNAQSATCDQCVPYLDLDASNLADANFTTSFAEGDINVKISDTDTDITDLNDVKITKAVLILTNRLDGTSESLSVLGTLPPGISIIDVYNNNDGQLVLSGLAAISSYEAAIEQIVYNNSSANPNQTTRQINVTVYDSENASNTAISFIGVTSQNDNPIARRDTNATTEGAVTINETNGSGSLLANDSDADYDPLTVTLINGISNPATDVTGSYGTLNWAADGTYTYTLNNSAVDGLAFLETVTETFTYTVSDGTGTDTEVLTIVITGTNDNPVAFDDSNQISELGTSITHANGSGTLLVNDTDIDGDNLNVESITSINIPANTSNDPGTSVAGTYGTLAWNNNGTYTYTRNATDVTNTATVTDVFDYVVSDANGTDIGRLVITILGQNLADKTITVAPLVATGTEGGSNPSFRFTKTGTNSATLVYYSVSGTAIAGSDYTALSGSVTIPTGSGTQTVDVTVPIINDLLAECSNETVIVTLLPATEGTLGTPKTATVTILDNDTVTPSVSVADVCSGNNITVNMTGATNLPNGTYDISYNIDGGGTLTASGVSVASGAAIFTTAGISPGAHTLNLTGVCDKTVIGSNDTFTINSPSSAASITGTASICKGSATDLAVTITGGVSPYGLLLSDGTTVNNYVSGSPINVSPLVSKSYTILSVSDANGCSGTGISATPAVVTVNQGSTAATISGATSICEGATANLAVAISGGTGPYTVVLNTGLTLTGYASGAAIPVTPSITTAYTISSVTDSNGCLGTGNAATATVTVTPIPEINLVGVSSPSTFGGSDGSISLSFTDVPDGTYNLSYATGSFNNVNIESGAVTISGLVAGDYNNIALSVGGCVTASNVDATITQSADLDIAVAGNGSENGSGSPISITYTVTLDKVNNTGSGITVNYSFSGGSATGGSDYTNSTTSIVIPNGASSGTITVPVIEDTDLESTESVEITLSTSGLPSGVSLNTPSATGTISDDDVASVTISASDATGNETPTDNGEFSVSLNKTNNTGSDITITYSIGGTATAGPGNDYTILSGTVIIADGQSSATIPVIILNDGLVENSETIVVTLVSSDVPTKVTVGAPGSATVTITDNDTASVTIDDATGTEGGNVSFTLELTQDVSGDVVIDVTFTGGTATGLGTDYTSTTQQFTFTGGTAGTKTVNVPAASDNLIEGNETFNVSLSLVSGNGSISVSDTGIGTIDDADDNAATEVNIVKTTDGVEGGASVVYTVSLSDGSNALTNNTGSPITVAIAFATGSTAVQGDLTTSFPTSISIADGASSAIVTLVVATDNQIEGNETLRATISSPSIGTVNTATADATIDDADDNAANTEVNIVKTTDGVEGGASVVYTVSLSDGSNALTNNTGSPITVA